MSFETNATVASFGGKLLKLSHNSTVIGSKMNLNLYLPPQAVSGTKVPWIFYLAGLTCTGDNGAEKGFFQQSAAKSGVAVVYPDTSPREPRYEGDDASWDFGRAAGFYINATKAPYSETYKMENYIIDELYDALPKEFLLDPARVSIMGHSMGGHGALSLYLKYPQKFKSVSAFAPISNPINCPWGQKAFAGYFGDDKEAWKKHDATELVKSHKGALDVLIDVGTGDNFYKQKQLLPENLEAAAKEAGHPIGPNGLNVRYQEDYDHSYYFISTFASDHVEHHTKFLVSQSNLIDL
ncbi:hypothetical protein AOL_s00083g240 [Orbilia oligospora ATCC 24927]|uniref:S-formylglutathione hydrolase n=1 Tax=Arthrobotrys oligospora (strain ATCC 24927 / CBS 115.81 / DSM 1491) TaxID=756982 RepID=G1XGV9_ARTOA|nr:hypothetical protein AOL_s00083g240 [Orbilia oligospora ATCC 24927]EGX47732.1 hypothetical protein AOL_s00083g240 [Orbilia oligospora ATCC 24927]